MSSRNVLRHGLALVLLAVTAAAAVAGCLAWSAAVDSRLDRLTHAAPLYVALGGLGAILALAARSPWRIAIVGLGLVAMLSGGVLVAPEFIRSSSSDHVAAPDGRIKVIQLNAQRLNTDVGRIADWLIAQNPDIVTVSEARKDLRDILVKRAGWSVAGGQGSLMIFTREPYIRMVRPKGLPGAGLTFVNATYAMPAGEVEVVTTHFERRAPTLAKQVQSLEQVAGQRPRRLMILTGDFNTTPWSAALRKLDDSLGLVRRDRAMGSWPAEVRGRAWPLPVLPIDHVYAGAGWATVKVERGPWLGSDHYPLVVTLAPVARP